MYSDYEPLIIIIGRSESNFVDDKEKSAMVGALRCDQ